MSDKARLTLGAITFRDRPFDDIVESAQAAGFESVGLTVGQCVSALERGVDLADIPELLERAGLRVGEFELFRLCPSPAVHELNSTLIELIPILRPDRIHTASFGGEPDTISSEFKQLCQRASTVDVAIEFMPYSAIPTLHEAVRLVKESRAPNARIVLDVLHFFRSGATLDDLTNDVLDVTACVQLSDVVPRPASTLSHEARHQRTFPGDGALPINAFLKRIHDIRGDFPPISVEPISDAIERLPLQWVADRAMVTTLRSMPAASLEPQFRPAK